MQCGYSFRDMKNTSKTRYFGAKLQPLFFSLFFLGCLPVTKVDSKKDVECEVNSDCVDFDPCTADRCAENKCYFDIDVTRAHTQRFFKLAFRAVLSHDTGQESWAFSRIKVYTDGACADQSELGFRRAGFGFFLLGRFSLEPF